MGTSLEDMQKRLGTAPAVTATPSVKGPPSGGTSLVDMQKRMQPNAPTLEQSVIAGTKEGLENLAGQAKTALQLSLKPYWDNYKQASSGYVQQVKDDKSQADQAPTLLHAAKSLMDVLQGPFVLPMSVTQTGVVEPLKAALAKLGSLVSEHVASDDTRTPQQKRENAPQKRPVIDWTVHKADVAQTVKGINDGLDILHNALWATVGGAEAGHAPELKEPILDVTEGAIRQQRRDAGAKELVPGKPHLTSQQLAAGLRSATAELTEPTPVKGLEPKTQGWDSVEPEEPTPLARAKASLRNLDTRIEPGLRVMAMEGGPVEGNRILDHLQNAVKDVPEAALWGKVIDGLKKNVSDVRVFVNNTLPDEIHEMFGGTISGYYDRNEHFVRVGIQESQGALFHTLIHELEHAGTARFVNDNPDHALVKRLDLVVQEAKKRALRMNELHRDEMYPLPTGDVPTGNKQLSHYGLTNSKEFLAELRSNPAFIDFLTRSEAYASKNWRGMNLFHHIADLFRQMLGIKDKNATPLLHEGLRLGDAIAEKQAGRNPVQAVRQMTSDAMMSASEFDPRMVDKAQKKVASWVTDVLKVVNPEAKGEIARAAGSVVARAVADRIRSTTAFTRNSVSRQLWWESRKATVDSFIERFEKGDKFADDPELARIADRYRQWNGQIFIQDLAHGIAYDPTDNYLYHTFEDSDEVRRWADAKYGKKWGDPSFMKERSFSLYKEAKDAGFVPRFDNPEDIMLARQHASDIAASKVDALEELRRFGLAAIKPKGIPEKGFRPKFDNVPRRSPNGDMYYIHQQAAQIVYNAFDSKSLWAMDNLAGSVFRGMMAVKNKIVPLRLGFPMFHALHVAHIANADMVTLSLKGMLSGTQGVVKTGIDFAKAAPLFVNGWKNARLGAGIVEAWMGKVRDEDLTAADRQNLTYMSEGGFVPIMDHHWNTGARAQFRKGIAQAKGGMGSGVTKAVWHAPWALMEGISAPLFEQWIPNLKTASYIKGVAQALKSDPSLLENPLKRQMAFRRISQSVDNRYGEMNYETLLWQKWAKDLAVLNTLSLGWQLGFIREYGGGAMELGQFARQGDRMQAIKQGKLDRALFASTYTMTALGYGGLLTWAMTGQPPETLMDYILPQTGSKGPDGGPGRVNTMFYTREFASIYKHVQVKGLREGMTELAESKASGVIGLFTELAKGVNSFGQEIRDPGAPAYQQVEESLAYVLSDMEPIAFKSSTGLDKQTALSVAGFAPAPNFMTDSATVGRIKDSYEKFVAPQEKPYDRLLRSKSMMDLRTAYRNGEEIGGKLDAMSTEFNLSGRDQRSIMRSLSNDEPSGLTLFKRLPWEEQKLMLDTMTPVERELYLPHSNKQHLRMHYAPPGP